MSSQVTDRNENPNSAGFTVLVVALFLYLFPVFFIPAGVNLALLSYILFGLIWAYRPILIPLGAMPFGVASILLWLACYSGMVTLLRGANDFTFAIQIAKVSILYLGSGVVIGVVCVLMRVPNSIDVLIRAFVVCCLVQAVFITASIFSVQFRVVMDSLFVATGNTNYLESFRVRGFSASGGPALGINQAVGVLSALYIFLKTNNGKYFFIALIIWIPTFFVARTGFFVGAAFIFLYFLSAKRTARLVRSFFLRPDGLSGIVVFLGFLLIFSPNLGDFFEPEAFDRIGAAFQWGFELFINAKMGSFETATTNALIEMLVIPSEPSFLLFGLGVFDTGAFGYERTDSGYLKTWYSSGLIGVFIFYSTIYFSLLNVAWKRNDRLFMDFMIIFVSTMFVVEIKEPFLYQNYLGRFVFILVGAGAVINWSESRNRFLSKPRFSSGQL